MADNPMTAKTSMHPRKEPYPLMVLHSAAHGLRILGHPAAADELFKVRAGFEDLLKAGADWIEAAGDGK